MSNSLYGKTFAVFIRYHVDVDPEIQGSFIATMDPFFVTIEDVINESFEPENQAPRIDEFLDTLTVRAGIFTREIVGYPIDFEMGDFDL